jgi:hypothetical protein
MWAKRVSRKQLLILVLSQLLIGVSLFVLVRLEIFGGMSASEALAFYLFEWVLSILYMFGDALGE